MDFCNQMFNPQYFNPAYYREVQAQVQKYELEQTREVANAVKAFHDMIESLNKLDAQHQQQAFCLFVCEMAKEHGWNL